MSIIKNIHVPVRVIKFEYDPICFGNAIVDIKIDCLYLHCISDKSQFFNQILWNGNAFTIEMLSKLIHKKIVLSSNDFCAYVNEVLLFIVDNLEQIKLIDDVTLCENNSTNYSMWYKNFENDKSN